MSATPVILARRLNDTNVVPYVTIRDLCESAEYDAIVWLNIQYHAFDVGPWVPPGTLTSLYLQNCKLCENIQCLPNSITSVEIKMCDLTDLGKLLNTSQTHLESIYAQNNCITAIPLNIPKNVMVIDLNNKFYFQVPSTNLFHSKYPHNQLGLQSSKRYSSLDYGRQRRDNHHTRTK